MVHAYIMVKAGSGLAETLSETIRDLDHVVAVNIVAGEYDLIVEADSGEVYEIISSVATRIRGFEETEDTKTYICLE